MAEQEKKGFVLVGIIGVISIIGIVAIIGIIWIIGNGGDCVKPQTVCACDCAG